MVRLVLSVNGWQLAVSTQLPALELFLVQVEHKDPYNDHKDVCYRAGAIHTLHQFSPIWKPLSSNMGRKNWANAPLAAVGIFPSRGSGFGGTAQSHTGFPGNVRLDEDIGRYFPLSTGSFTPTYLVNSEVVEQGAGKRTPWYELEHLPIS